MHLDYWNKLIKEKISRLKKKAIVAPMIKNGAKGISVFIPILMILLFDTFFEKKIKNNPKIAPIQNEIMIAERATEGGNIQPIPRISFASPKPIHLPLETSQSKAKGKAKIGPDKILSRDGHEKLM